MEIAAGGVSQLQGNVKVIALGHEGRHKTCLLPSITFRGLTICRDSFQHPANSIKFYAPQGLSLQIHW